MTCPHCATDRHNGGISLQHNLKNGGKYVARSNLIRKSFSRNLKLPYRR